MEEDFRAILYSLLDTSVMRILPTIFYKETQHSWYINILRLTNTDIAWNSEVNWREVYIALEDGIDSAQKNRDPFIASVFSNVEAMKILLRMGYDPSMNESRVLYLAAGNGYLHTVLLLLEDGRADPTARNSMSLRLASENGHSDIVHVLLRDKRADPTSLENDALKKSLEERHLQVTMMLLQDKRAMIRYTEGLSF